MRALNGKRIFLGCLLIGMAVVLVPAGWDRFKHPRLAYQALRPNVGVTEQLQPKSMRGVANRRFHTVIDLRPDGEAADQPSSAEMARAASAEGLKFVYIPVPHGRIPDDAVNKLQAALGNGEQNVLMYCRSGRRAARTWALVEASRAGGAGATEIMQAVREAGQSADDLRGDIEQRIARRPQLAKGAP